MKKHYIELELEIEKFDNNQMVISTSGTEEGGIGDNGDELEF